MSSVSTDISTLTKSTEPYSAKASIVDGEVDNSTTKLTGDRTTKLFSNAAKTLGKNDFLTLLVTQMKFQDPLNPMENTEFVSQLAQFTALENSSNIETAIGKLNDSFQSTVSAQQYTAQSISNTAAVSLIGKEVRLRQVSVDWSAKAGENIPIRVHIGNADKATVELLNSDGEVVKTMEAAGKDSQNSVDLKWDGTTDAGTIAKAGKYKIHVVGEETDSSLYSFVQDVIDGVRFSTDGALIKVDGKELSIGNVLDVSTEAGAGSTSNTLTPSTAVSLLGKTVRVRESTIRFQGADQELHNVNVNAPADSTVRVNITDSKGNVVYYQNVKADSKGVALFSWDGEMINGRTAAAGTYTISIQGEKTNPSLYAYTEGRIDGVSNISGGAQLRYNGKTISMSDILDIAV